MTNVVSNFPPVAPAKRQWQSFDSTLVIFLACDFLFTLAAGLLATSRIGPCPLCFKSIAVMMLLPLKLVLAAVSLIYLIVRAIRKKANSYSVLAFTAALVALPLVPVAFGGGESFGRYLLDKTGVNERVARECVLIAESELCKTDVWIFVGSDVWRVPEKMQYLRPVAQELRTKCPTICGLKPRDISCRPQSVSIELHGGFDHFGYGLHPDGTNWVLRWYSENAEPVELARLSRQEPALKITN